MIERLSSVGGGQVALVSAPPGSGKSVLLQSWVETAGLADQAAWVSVERGERDAQRFWLSVIDSLAAAELEIERFSPTPEFRSAAAVERLLSDLTSLERPLLLVIDDLHELESPDALEWLEVLLSRLPSSLRVVLSTRKDPGLGLHRLRLAGRLTEIRPTDLRFSLDEACELLAASGIELSAAGLELLYERTEGWAAGLRLAAISLAGHPDPEVFVREFSGSERTVAGYLIAEVLEHHPPEVRELLLRTSVLERVSGPLADFMTGGSGSERIFQELEDANAFVSSLDVGRTWFRYHQLFADLLRLELRRTVPAIIGSLHRAAAQWHEQEGYIVEAIRHAQAARDWPLASRLLADNHLDLTLDGRTGAVCGLLTEFPRDVAAADPELALVFATARLLDGRRSDSQAYLDLAGRLAGAVATERKPRFDELLAVLTLVLARWRGDLETVLETMPVVESELATPPAGESALSEALRAAAFQNLGVAELWSGRFDDARRDLEQSLALARRAGRPWLEIPPLGHLGVALPWTGLPLSAGLAQSEEAVRIAEAHGWSDDPVIVTPLATTAMALLWVGRFDEAERALDRAVNTLNPGGEPGTELIVHHARGLLWLARGELERALAAFRAAARMEALLARRHAFAPARRARLIQTQARMGELAAARAELASTSEEERQTGDMHMTAAALHLIENEPEQAIDALAPVMNGLPATIYRAAGTTEAQVLDAVAREQLGDRRAAEASLERALELAEPEGLILPFALAPVRGLVERHPRHRTAHATLLNEISSVLAGASRGAGGDGAPLRDDLSDAELRVVRYLPSNLRAPEIAAELMVSTNTVRTHLRHIYGKLEAHNRAEAVARARELRLLAPGVHMR